MRKVKELASLEDLEETLKTIKHPKLYLFDILDFKKINLRYGDDAGNFALDKVAYSFEKYANENEMQLFYVNHDEFVLLEDKPFDLEEMERLLFSLLALCEKKTYIYPDLDVELEVELTLGICLDKMKLLEKAYKALNLAKAQNRPFITYSEFVNQEWSQTQKVWAEIIRRAIKGKRLYPYFQAVCDENGEIIYFDTLSRINIGNETKPTNDFFDVVKSQNLTHDLTKAMFEAIIQKETPKPCSLNLGIEDIKDKNTLEIVKENNKIIYELPLTNAYEDLTYIAEFIDLLNVKSERIILDNVSSVGIFGDDGIDIKKIGIIKLDGDLIKNIHLDQIAVKRVENIKNYAQKFGVKVIATHVNSQKTFQKVKNLGIELFQGYYFQHPSQEPSIKFNHTLNKK